MDRDELLGLLKRCKQVKAVVHLSSDRSMTAKISKADARKMIEDMDDGEEAVAIWLESIGLLILG